MTTLAIVQNIPGLRPALQAMCKVYRKQSATIKHCFTLSVYHTYPFLELLLEEGTYYGHDDTDVPGLVQYVKPLETGWKSFLYKDIKHVSCYNEFSLGRSAVMATVQFAHEVYHSQVSSNNSLTVIDCSIPTTVEGCSSQYEAGY